MKITKLNITYYRERKIPSLGGVLPDRTITIHKVINNRVGRNDLYPFRNTRTHNKISLLKSFYRQYKTGRINKEDFLNRICSTSNLEKYIKRFK